MTAETFEKAEELRSEIKDLRDIIDVLKDSTISKNNYLCAIEVGGLKYSSAHLSECMRDKLIEVVQEVLKEKEAEFANL